MGATHKETVTELVKTMISAGIIKPKDNIKDFEKYILKKSIYLVEYGVRIFRDPKTQEIVDSVIIAETKKKTKQKPDNDVKILKDLKKW